MTMRLRSGIGTDASTCRRAGSITRSTASVVEASTRSPGLCIRFATTPLNVADKKAEKVKEFGASQPMKRPAQPEEIAPAFVYFASEVDSSYITGEVLTLLGGETAAA